MKYISLLKVGWQHCMMQHFCFRLCCLQAFLALSDIFDNFTLSLISNFFCQAFHWDNSWRGVYLLGAQSFKSLLTLLVTHEVILSLWASWRPFSRPDLVRGSCSVPSAELAWHGQAPGACLPDLVADARCREHLQGSTICQKERKTNCVLWTAAPKPAAIHPGRHSEKPSFSFAYTVNMLHLQ